MERIRRIEVLRSVTPDNPFKYLLKCANSSIWQFVQDETSCQRPSIWVAPVLETPGHRKERRESHDDVAPSEEVLSRSTFPTNALKDFVRTLRNFEEFALFGLVLCFQAMLYDVTMMPIRAVWTAGRLIQALSTTYVLQCKSAISIRNALRTLSTAALSIIVRVGHYVKPKQVEVAERLQLLSPQTRTRYKPSSREKFTPTQKRLMSHDGCEYRERRESVDLRDIRITPSPIVSRARPPLSTIIGSHDLICLLDFLVVLAVSLIFRMSLDVSAVYHFIRGQSLLKLYVVFNMLEMAERMWRSLERDLLDDLRVQVDNFLRMSVPTDAQELRRGRREREVLQASSRTRRAREALSHLLSDHRVKFGVHFLMAVLCVSVHTGMHLSRGLLLCIAMNTPESAMFLLLVTNNFGEIKTSVFKKQTPQTLWRLAASDVVERFQIFADIFFVYLQIHNSPREEAPASVRAIQLLIGMLLIEVFVDFSKHAFLVKFNRLPAQIFRGFRMICMMDVLVAREPTASLHIAPKVADVPVVTPGQGMLPFAHVASKRLGFITLPFLSFLVAFTPRPAADSLFNMSTPICSSLIVAWGCLYTLFILSSALTLSFCVSRRSELMSAVTSQYATLQPL